MMDAIIGLIPNNWHVSHACWNKEKAHFTLTREVAEYVSTDTCYCLIDRNRESKQI